MKKILLGLLVSSFLLAAEKPAASVFSSDIKGTFAAAKKAKKPILIDFFGIWCPPCNQLDETVFETAAFLKKAKAFQLLKVDADDKKSWELKNRYKVGGYPTIIFTDANGSEIYRVVGYRTLREFLKVMEMAGSAKAHSLENACKSPDTDDLWRCLVISSERNDADGAEKAVKGLANKLKPGSARYDLARGYVVEKAPTEDLKRDGFARLLTDLSQSPLALNWALEYLKTFEGQNGLMPKNELVEKALSFFDAMKTDSRLDEFGLSLADLTAQRADLLEHLGKTEEAKKVWKAASDLLETQAKEQKGPARSFALERIGCLELAGEVDAALRLASEYRDKYPGEFTFHYRVAALLSHAKKYTEAVPNGQKAFELSYGDNRIRVATLLLTIFGALGNRTDAQKIYDAVKKEARPEKEIDVRTHRYLKTFDEAWAKTRSVK